MLDLVLRFFVGGIVVSLFAMLGDILRPRSFAGLFGAAPSIALATVGLTIHKNGELYAAQEAHSMMLAAVAFLVYAALVSIVLHRFRRGTLLTTVLLMPVWLGVSLGLLKLVAGRL